MVTDVKGCRGTDSGVERLFATPARRPLFPRRASRGGRSAGELAEVLVAPAAAAARRRGSGSRPRLEPAGTSRCRRSPSRCRRGRCRPPCGRARRGPPRPRVARGAGCCLCQASTSRFARVGVVRDRAPSDAPPRRRRWRSAAHRLGDDEDGTKVDHHHAAVLRQQRAARRRARCAGWSASARADECEKITGAAETRARPASSPARRARGRPACRAGSSRAPPPRRTRVRPPCSGVVGRRVGPVGVVVWVSVM